MPLFVQLLPLQTRQYRAAFLSKGAECLSAVATVSFFLERRRVSVESQSCRLCSPSFSSLGLFALGGIGSDLPAAAARALLL